VRLHIRSQFHIDFIPSGHRRPPSAALLLSLAGDAERHLEVEPLCFLEMIDHLEKITSLRVAAGTKHAHQALCRPFGPTTQLVEPDCRVDIVAKNRLSGIEIPRQQALDAFPQKLLISDVTEIALTSPDAIFTYSPRSPWAETAFTRLPFLR
jgi:hypothetical protein